MQGDGNFVCSTSQNAYFSTGTYNCCNNTKAADKVWFSSAQPYLQMISTSCNVEWAAANTVARTKSTPIFGSTGFISPTPVPSNQFISSFGVNTHLSQGWSLNTTITEAVWVGASTIREGILENLISSYKSVADAGLKLNLLPITSNNLNISDNIRILETAAQNSPGAITSIEGFNEVNNQPFTYNGVDPKVSYAGMAQAMKDLYNGVKASSILKDIPVYDLTAGNSGPDSASLGLTDIKGYADYANVHPYSYNGDNSVVGWSYFSSNMNGDYPTWQNTPRVITELGWPSLVYSSNSQGVSELAQSKLSVNAILNSIKEGYRQCFLYELLDEQWGNPQNTEEHFGLFNHDQTPKPVAQVLRTITGLLKDSGSGPSTSFNYSVDGFPLTTGKHLLFQMQQPASFWLAIWNDAAAWNPMSQTDPANDPYTLTVQLGTNKFTQADFTVYNPYSTVIAGSPPASQNFPGVTKVTFQANDYLMLVKVVPK